MFVRGLTFLFLLLFVAAPAQAATLYIDPAQKTLGRGDAQVFKVRIDTDEAQNECINTVSGVVSFDGPLTPIDISTGESILSVWLEPPTLDKQKSQITFTGGIPNGYCGRIDGDPRLTNTLFEIVARAAVTEGELETASISFTNQTEVLLNDGFGTTASLELLSAAVTIAPTANEVVADPWAQRIGEDFTPPQEFSIQLEKGEKAFSGKYYVSFSTTDKETGIDHYEIMEEPLSQSSSFLWGQVDAPWREVRSPYVLADQSLNSTIRVKAIDKAGNEYIATLIPDEGLRSISAGQITTYMLYGTLLVGLAILVFAFVHMRSSASRKNDLVTEYEDVYSDSENDPDEDRSE